MIEILKREAVYIWYFFDLQLRQIAFYWILGILIGSFFSVFLKESINSLMEKFNGKVSKTIGLILSSSIGIASPLCMYGTVPIVASLSIKGIPDSFLIAFMMSSILLNPQLIIYSFALGFKVLLIRIFACFLMGIIAGALVAIFEDKVSFFSLNRFSVPQSRDIAKNPFLRFLFNVWRNIKVTGPFFLFGILLSAIFQRYVSEEIMSNLFGGNKTLGVFLTATIGVPLYACGGGTIPLIQTWLSSGLSVGAATSFMLFGPATKITNLGALKTILGIKNFLIYLVFSFLISILFGVLINFIF